MCDDNSDLSICETLEERIDVGIAIIEPSADIKLTGAGSFLSSLSNIPSDLLDFYTDFGFHVRRGFQTLQRNLQSNGFISDIASYLPKNKIDTKSVADDPQSPYSINYSGEYNKKDQGYSYVINHDTNKNQSQTGIFKFSPFSPPSQSSMNFTWPNHYHHGNPAVQNDDNKYNIKDTWDYGNIVLYSAEQESDKHLYSMNYERMKQKLKQKEELEKKNQLIVKLFQQQNLHQTKNKNKFYANYVNRNKYD